MNKRKVINRIYLIAIFVFASNYLTACECLKLQPFLGNISKETRISRIRIIEHGNINTVGNELPKYDINNLCMPPPPPPPRKNYSSYTKIAVIDNLLGKQLNDTILFLNDYRGTCGAHLGYAEIGSEFIIRFNENQIDQTDIEDISQSLKSNIELVTASDCINWELKVNKTKVKGNIFTCKRAEEVQKLHNSVEKLTNEERVLRYEQIKNITEEEIEYVMLIRKLKEIENTLNNKP